MFLRMKDVDFFLVVFARYLNVSLQSHHSLTVYSWINFLNHCLINGTFHCFCFSVGINVSFGTGVTPPSCHGRATLQHLRHVTRCHTTPTHILTRWTSPQRKKKESNAFKKFPKSGANEGSGARECPRVPWAAPHEARDPGTESFRPELIFDFSRWLHRWVWLFKLCLTATVMNIAWPSWLFKSRHFSWCHTVGACRVARAASIFHIVSYLSKCVFFQPPCVLWIFNTKNTPKQHHRAHRRSK